MRKLCKKYDVDAPNSPNDPCKSQMRKLCLEYDVDAPKSPNGPDKSSRLLTDDDIIAVVRIE